MDRLALYIIWLGAIAIAGSLVIAALAMGYYSVWAIVICVIAGIVIAYPSGKIVSNLIKRKDPAWDARHDAPQPDLDQRRTTRTDPTE